MSISSRISALVAAVAVDIKDLYTKYTSIVQNRVVYLPTLQINVTELTNTLMVSYTPGLLRVFHTGILLRNGVDYQAVDGIQIVFVEQLPAGTEIDVERISVQNGVELTLGGVFNTMGSLDNLTTTDKTNLVAAINEVNTKSTASTTPYSSYSLNKDSEGVYTVVEIKTNSGVLYARSTLSGGTSPQYTTRTINYYGTDGTTITTTNVFTINYDGDNIVSEVLT